MKNLIWRLPAKITVDDVTKLLASKVITPEEAKDIFFRLEGDVPQDQLEEIKEELKLLRELVLKLSEENHSTVPIIIREIEKVNTWPVIPYWTNTYTSFCSSNGSMTRSGTINLKN